MLLVNQVVILVVVVMHLDDAEALVFDDMQAEFVFPLPAAAQRPKALSEERRHVRTDDQLDEFVSAVLREERNLVLDLLCLVPRSSFYAALA